MKITPVPKSKRETPKAKLRRLLTSQRRSLQRRARPKSKGKSRFPKRRDPAFLKWMSERIHCVVVINVGEDGFERGEATCGGYAGGRGAIETAHVKTRGSGGYDLGNCVRLCRVHHDQQEGKTAAFQKRYGIDLQKWANLYADQYQKSVALGWSPEKP